MANKVTKMHVLVSHLESAVYDDEAESVTLPGSGGVLTILPLHAPLITPLTKGTITITNDGETKEVAIEKGLLEVSGNQVSVLM